MQRQITPLRALPLLALLAFGCGHDALYAYCTDSDQCGSRTYDEGDTELEVFLDCVETQVVVSPDRTTLGNSCTIECVSDRDCDSLEGLDDGYCLRWEGSDEFFCYQGCDAGERCYPSSTCEQVTIDDDPAQVCLPNQT